MTRILLIAAAGALLATSASAAPLISQRSAVSPASVVENVRLVCDEYGRCYRSRGYAARRYYRNSYAYQPQVYAQPSYGYSQPGYGYRQPGYGYGNGYYGGGPTIGFSFGGGGW